MVDFTHKILAPQRSPHIVPRQRLLDQLAVIADRRLLTITGPAGYGKTSLAIDLAAQASLPVCWYSLDPSDADPRVFLEYLTAAVEQRFVGATRATSALLAGGSHPCPSVITASLCRDIYTLGNDLILIIDDWHLIDHIEEINAIVGQLVMRCPNCHLLLISRTYPSIPNTMLLTARREMLSLDEQHLRFTTDEVAAVLRAEFRIDLSEQRAAALTERFNGWITGVLLSVQVNSMAPVLQVGDTLHERQAYRFLAEQVFAYQPAAVQSFLLDSAIFEELTVTLGEQILGRADTRAMLDQALRRHLFISEVRPGVFRYHALFRDFLRELQRTADPARYRDLVARVTEHYVAQEQWSLAFEMALSADEKPIVRRVLAAGGERLYTSGRLETLKHWFDVLTTDQLSPPLLCLKARVLLDFGHVAEATIAVQAARLQCGPDEAPQVAILEAHLDRLAGRYRQALETIEAVLAAAPFPERQAALRTQGICLHRVGHTDRAIATFHEALAVSQQVGDRYTIALIWRDLGICHRALGQLELAESYYDQADAYWAGTGNAGHRAMSLNSKAIVQHLKGQYAPAHTSMVEALNHARTSGLRSYEAIILSCLGDLYSDLQLWDRAQQVYADARLIGGNAHLLADLEIAPIQSLVRQRQYDEAARLLRQAARLAHSRPALLHYLSGCVACGLGDLERAEAELATLLGSAEQLCEPLDRARTYVLQAQLAAARADRAGIVQALERAAQVAAQLGSDAFLVVELLPIRSVLHRAVAAGWQRGKEWLHRQQDLALVASQIDQDDQRPLLVVRTLGADEILLDGQPLALGWAKARELLYYLLAHPKGATIESLREVIWPDLPTERSRETLRSAIYQLRSALPRDLIVLHGRHTYQIARDLVRLEYDAEQFAALVEQRTDLDALFEAVTLYQGSYLASTDNSWPTAQRTYLERCYLGALTRLAEHAEAERDFDEALELYQRALAIDPLDEAVHARVMGCYIERGNRAAALLQYHTIRRLLDEELGLEPGAQSSVELLYRQLLAA